MARKVKNGYKEKLVLVNEDHIVALNIEAAKKGTNLKNLLEAEIEKYGKKISAKHF